MIKSSVKFLELPLFILLFSFLVVLCVFSRFSNAVMNGINLWFACVLPALFPYLFITTIISSLSITRKIFYKLTPVTRSLFNVSGSVGYAFMLSLISGYPMGAKTVSDLKLAGDIGENESVRASALCSTSSPVFLISTVGGIMFNNKAFGFCVFLVHILSAFLTGIIFSFYKRKDKPVLSAPSLASIKSENILYETAYSSVITVLVVGSLITIFYLLTEVLSAFKILTPAISALTFITGNENIAKGIVFGIFECTKGLKTMSVSGFSALPYVSAVCSFGGFSVIGQSLAFLKKAKIKTAPFIFSKIISAVISLLLGFVLLIFVQ